MKIVILYGSPRKGDTYEMTMASARDAITALSLARINVLTTIR